MTENEEYLYNHFLISIKSGFQSFEDIIDEVYETREDEGWESEITDEWIDETVKREYDKHLADTKTWQHPTDSDRLHAAFDELCRQNIVALHNAGYTKSEAEYDAVEVWKDIEDAGGNPIGYCYYHGQDLERVIQDGELYIGFSGAKENNDKEAIIVGNKIVAVLKNAGFNVDWNGSASKRIKIIDFKWQNAYTSDEDVEEKWGYDRVIALMTEQ